MHRIKVQTTVDNRISTLLFYYVSVIPAISLVPVKLNIYSRLNAQQVTRTFAQSLNDSHKYVIRRIVNKKND